MEFGSTMKSLIRSRYVCLVMDIIFKSGKIDWYLVVYLSV